MHFAIGDWYATLHHCKTRVAYDKNSFYQTCLIAEVYGWNAKRVLEQGALYPWNDANQLIYHRFKVLLDGHTYQIYDRQNGDLYCLMPPMQ